MIRINRNIFIDLNLKVTFYKTANYYCTFFSILHLKFCVNNHTTRLWTGGVWALSSTRWCMGWWVHLMNSSGGNRICQLCVLVFVKDQRTCEASESLFPDTLNTDRFMKLKIEFVKLYKINILISLCCMYVVSLN